MFTDERPCKCISEFQDKLYGKGRRLHNLTIARSCCTVCGNKSQGGGYKNEDKK